MDVHILLVSPAFHAGPILMRYAKVTVTASPLTFTWTFSL